MKTTINTETFRNAITLTNLIKANRQLPVLAYARLSVKDHTAKLTTTDMEKVIEVTFSTKGSDDFAVLLPRRRTQTFLYGKDTGNTTIEITDSGTTLGREGLGNLKFKPPAVKDFPSIPTPADDMAWVTIDAKWLSRMLDVLIPACAQEESRPVLFGVVFSDGAMASADGFRLVEVEHEKAQFGLGDKQVIIPFQPLLLIRKLFGKEDKISIGFRHPDRVYFKSDKVLLSSQTIQGNYPNLKPLIPKKFNYKVSFSSPLMMQRLRMLNVQTLIAGIVRLQFQRTGEHNEPECLLSGGDEKNKGSYSMRLPVNIETSDEARIAFDYKFLCDAIKPFSVCNFELTSPSSPGKFTGDIEGLTIVVMPIFVQW